MADSPKQTETKIPLPKRLVLLLVLITITAIFGLQFQQSVLFSILLLLIITACLGRQKSGLIMLRLYSCTILLLTSSLPIFIYQTADTTKIMQFFPMLIDKPDWLSILLWIGVSLISILQVYLAFNHKISAYFKHNVNLNIIG